MDFANALFEYQGMDWQGSVPMRVGVKGRRCQVLLSAFSIENGYRRKKLLLLHTHLTSLKVRHFEAKYQRFPDDNL